MQLTNMAGMNADTYWVDSVTTNDIKPWKYKSIQGKQYHDMESK